MSSTIIAASLTGSLHQFNRLLSRVTLKRQYDQLFLRITDDELAITQPTGEVSTYCTITDQYLHSIELRSDSPTLAIIDVDELHDYLNLATSKLLYLDFMCEPESDFASEVHIKDDLKRTVGISTPQTAFRPRRAALIANSHGIDPDCLSDVDNGRDTAEILHEELIRSMSTSQRGTIHSERSVEDRLYDLPVTEMRRLSLMQVYEWIHDNEFSVEYPEKEIAELYDQFDRSNRLLVSTGSKTAPASATIRTTQSVLEKIIEARELVGGQKTYPIIIKNGEFWLEVVSGAATTEGWLGAAKVEGPSLCNEYGPTFETVVEGMSGAVELQTAPENDLAFIQRDSGVIVRHVIEGIDT
ncbi:hypothetical protein [Halobaculum halobium]|uniref:Uncharacterized protein n=1 Tax=Halobaculum halobium TaxID=3032281 RepID=A0ABD5TAV3_9EURY|nr:hypothetical protein [Halobaculum sp. SYNS20]